MDELTKSTASNLIPEKENTAQIVLQANGDGVQQIAYAQNVNTNNIIVVSANAQACHAEFSIPEATGRNRNYYHLVVIDDEVLIGDNKLFTLKLSTEDALMKNTELSLIQNYARLENEAIEKLVSFPALFIHMKKSKEDDEKINNAHFGVIYNIRKNRDYILLDCMLSTHFCRNRIVNLYKQLSIDNSYFVDELCIEHWALKECDLFEILHAAYIPVGF